MDVLMYSLHQRRPVLDARDHVTAKNKVKGFLGYPFGFDVVNDELYVGRNPKDINVSETLHRGGVFHYHRGCMALRSFPIICTTVSQPSSQDLAAAADVPER